MSAIATIHFMNVPFGNDYKHTLYFPTEYDQTAYFTQLINKKYSLGVGDSFSYQRKDGDIRVPFNYDEVVGLNYVMYKNTSSDKWYYAFITEYEYLNPQTTKIHIETDVIQTWLFDYEFLDTFIEREHVDSDKPGEHLIDEGLSVSDYTVNASDSVGYGNLDSDEPEPLYVVIGVTEYMNDDGTSTGTYGIQYNGIHSGISYYAYKHSDNAGIQGFLEKYAEGGKSDAIICMFLAPFELLDTYLIGNKVVGSSLPSVTYINTGDTETKTNRKVLETQENRIDGYVPNNKKLLTYPYRYLLVSNNSGVECIYRYENFEKSTGVKYSVNPKFKIQGCLTPGCSIRMVPMYYKGASLCDVEGINLGKYPTLNWTSDYYTNWLTQNAVNIAIDTAGAVGSIAGGVGMIATGNVVGGVGATIGGVSQIANTVNSMYQASLVPNQSHGNINCGDVVTASMKNDFIFYDMCIKKEQSKVIDSFFDMFGYKVNRVGIPRKAHRKRCWYTKTIDANIKGDIPNIDIQKIKNAYNNGITFWRHTVAMGTYYGNDIT